MTLLEEYATTGLIPLARKYGVHTLRLRDWIVSEGGTIYQQGQRPGIQDEEQAARIVEMRRAGVKYSVIQYREKCSSKTIWKALRRAGLTVTTKGK